MNLDGQSDAVTKTEAQKIIQAMLPTQKLRAVERLYYSARQLRAAALRAQHPDWTDKAICEAVRKSFLGYAHPKALLDEPE